MSTRGAIAYKTPTGWKGVYQHFDSYPDGLGAGIWKVLHEKFLNNKGTVGVTNDGKTSTAIQAFIDVMIKGHPGGWSGFDDTCYCHDIDFVLRDGVRNGQLDSKHNDPLFIEYVYILDPKTCTMEVLSSTSDKSKMLPGSENSEYTSGGSYGHRRIAIVDITGTSPEPDWEHMEPGDDAEPEA